MKTFSLRLKLTLMLLLLAVMTWGIASSLAWYQTYKTINELFDTQQMVFAKTLVSATNGYRFTPSIVE
ncbi:Sensor protein qseC [Providencia alcalifaciens]|nr:Sensor protein qseC [Providencia alcalifaciens]